MSPSAVFDLIRAGLGPANLLSARAGRALPKVGLPDATRSISARSDRVWLAAARNRQTRLQPSKGRSQQLRTPDAGRTCSSTSVRLVLACMARLYASRRRCPPVQTARMLEHCGAVLFKVLAEIGLASWREKRRQVAPASVEAIAVERTRITKAVMAAGFQVRLPNR